MIVLYFVLEICTTMMVAHVHGWTRWLDFLAISVSTLLLLLELRFEVVDPESNMKRVVHRVNNRKRLKGGNNAN